MNGVKILSRRSRKEILGKVREYAGYLRRAYGDDVLEAYVIGSVASGTHGPRSDVDIVLVVKDPRKLSFTELKIKAAETIGLPVDLIVLSERDLEYHRSRNTRFYRELSKSVKIL